MRSQRTHGVVDPIARVIEPPGVGIILAGLVMATGLFAAGAATAGQYYIVDRDPTALTAIDLGSAKRTGSTIRAKVTTATVQPYLIADLIVAYIESDDEYDCRRRKIRNVFAALFAEDGDFTPRIEVFAEWKPVETGSVADLTLTALCEPSSRKAEQVEEWDGPRDIVNDYRLSAAD